MFSNSYSLKSIPWATQETARQTPVFQLISYTSSIITTGSTILKHVRTMCPYWYWLFKIMSKFEIKEFTNSSVEILIAFWWRLGKTCICPWFSFLTFLSLLFLSDIFIIIISHYYYFLAWIDPYSTPFQLNVFPYPNLDNSMFAQQPAAPCSLDCEKRLALVRLVIQKAAQVARSWENSLLLSPWRHFPGAGLSDTGGDWWNTERVKIWLAVNRTPTQMSELG